MPELRLTPSAELTPAELRELRRFLETTFSDGWDDADWEHAMGGMHAVVRADSVVIAHGSVVPRRLRCGSRELHTGYVEALAVSPSHRRLGHARAVMMALAEQIAASYELGALADGSGIDGFYERLGWQRWRGPTSVLTPAGPQRTADEDGNILVLPTRHARALDLDAELTCDWRTGDVW